VLTLEERATSKENARRPVLDAEEMGAVAHVARINGEVMQWPPTVVAHPASSGEAHRVAVRRGRARGARASMGSAAIVVVRA
jgi:hypothetical protein